MRALLLVAVFAAASALGPAALSSPPLAAASLLRLGTAIGGQPVGARVQVLSERTTENRPPLRTLERTVLPGAHWSGQSLGAGEVFTAQLRGVAGRIAWVPLPQGGGELICSRSADAPPQGIGLALGRLGAPLCGGGVQLAAALMLRLGGPLAPRAVRGALQRLGARSVGVIAGPKGLYAVAYLPTAGPRLQVGGSPMNLALQATYDRARGMKAVLAAPTLPAGSP